MKKITLRIEKPGFEYKDWFAWQEIVTGLRAFLHRSDCSITISFEGPDPEIKDIKRLCSTSKLLSRLRTAE